MATSATFELKNSQSDGETLIYLIFRFNHYKVSSGGKKLYEKVKISTGEKVNPQNWKNHRATNDRNFDDPAELNQRLTNIEAAVNDVYRRLVNDGVQVTPDRIRIELDKLEYLFANRATKAIKTAFIQEKETNFIPFIENFVNTVTMVYKNGSPHPINQRTKQKYFTVLKLLKEFSAASGLTKFDQVNRGFYEKFITYLQNTVWYCKEINGELITKQYSENTIGKYVANLKTFLQHATEAGINTNMDFKNRKFAVPGEEVDKIYLRESELLSLKKLDLSNLPGLESARDLFLIGCYTALRYSDYTNIRPENIVQTDHGQVIKLTTQKTGQTVIIPLHWIVREILQKYNNILPKAISNQKTNDHLKELGKRAGINEQVSITKMTGGVKGTLAMPKYKLISSHTARRTGATNMYLAGIPVHSIMKITGHKSEQSFLRYLRFSEEDNARLLQNNPFFQQVTTS